MIARRTMLALTVGVAACATPGQVRRVETQVLMGQQVQARADSAHAAQLLKLAAQQQRMMDSMLSLTRSLDEKIAQSDRNSQAAADDIRRDISVLAQANNVSQQKLAQIRTDMEARAAATSGDTAAVNASDETIWAAANHEFDIGRFQSARDAYRDLVTNHPTSAYVPKALIRIGGTFGDAQPDSARTYYQMVLKLPPSAALQSALPTALWKLGLLEEARKNSDAAKAYFKQIVDKYPNSVEYTSALDKIRKP